MPFQKPSHLIGRYAVVKPWPDIQAAEDENIARLKITSRAMGLECIVVDPEGVRLDPPYNMVTERDVDFVINLHFETPKAYNAFSFVALWNPIRFFREWGYRRYSRHLMTHDDFLSCSSTWADDHVLRMLHNDPTRLPACFTMYHSLSEPVIEPTLGERKVFYAGINWERLDKKKKGRHQDLLRCLDKDGVLRIHGPKLFSGVNVWEGYDCYVGPLPFDGVSVVHAIAQAGISLVFSSDAHKESELMSNRLFESMAAGAVIICDENPFARKFLGDRLLYVDSLAPMQQVREQILAHLAWIKANPQEALAKARAAQAVFRERFTLDRSLAAIYGQLDSRKRQLAELYAPAPNADPVHLLMLLPEFSEQALENLLASAATQRLAGVQPILLVDEGDYRTYGADIQAGLKRHSLQAEVRPLPFFVRRKDGSWVRRQFIGKVVAPVIESLPEQALFMLLAPNERLFSEHVAALLRVLQQNTEAGFAFAPVVMRHVLDSKLTYDLLPDLNIQNNWNLPPGFGRYLIRKSAIKPEQMAVARYLDLHLLKPILGELKGVCSKRTSILARIQEPFVSNELVDGVFEHEVSLDHLESLNGAVDLRHLKPVLTHNGQPPTSGTLSTTTNQDFLIQLEQRDKPNLKAAAMLRRMRQTLIYERVYQESVFAAAEADVVAALQEELPVLRKMVMEDEKCDGFLAYAAGLCLEASSDGAKAFRAFNRALSNAALHYPAQYPVRCALRLVRLALRQSETKVALQVVESVILKIQPNNRLGRDLSEKLKAGCSAAQALKLLPFDAPPAHEPPPPKTEVPVALETRVPLVAAIVSAYKSERFMRGCLEDLTSQTLFAQGLLEIVVVDSASPENEKAIVEEYRQRFPNILYIRSEQRETVYGAWNRGIKASRGKYLTNANTDDRHRRDALEVLAQTLDRTPEVALVYADVLVTQTENATFADPHATNHFKWLDFDRRALLEKGCFVGPQPMWRREVHETHGWFDDTLQVAGDYEFWLRLASQHQFLHVKETLGLYLESPASVEHANRDRVVQESAAARARHRAAILGQMPPAPAPAAPSPTVAATKPAELPACARVGRLDEARRAFGEKKLQAAWELTLAALQCRPFHPEAHLLLAEIAGAAGDSVTARRCAQSALDMAPGLKAAKRFLRGNLRGNAKPEWLKLPEALLDPPKRRQPALSVCLIVRNEEQFLGRCLDSVRGLANQIVVVDTGSTDRTVEIARAHGAQVHSFTWCDDFSAARNVALEHANGDWVLALDADEEMPPDQHDALRKHLLAEAVISWRLPIRDAGREEEGQSYVPRLFRNAPGLYYTGRIHEQVFRSVEDVRRDWGLDTRLGEACLLHHGYSKALTLDRDKVARNLRLLEMALDESPDDANLLMSHGLELTRAGRREEGLAAYRAAFDLLSRVPATQVVPELREMLLAQFSTHLTAAQRRAEVVALLTSPLAKAGAGLTSSLHFTLGLAQMELGEFGAASEQFRQCLAKRGRPVLAPINPEIHRSGPHHCLALSLERSGDAAGAEREFEAAHQAFPDAAGVVADWGRFLHGQGRPVDALQMLHRFVQQNPSAVAVWVRGGLIALSQAAFLEVALDWTAEALRLHPEDRQLQAQRAEALLLAGKVESALPLWRQLGAGGDGPAAGAVVVCETALGDHQFQPEPQDVAAITAHFVNWYRRLIEFGATTTVQRINAGVDGLGRVLPQAAELLRAVIADVGTQTSGN